MRVDRCDVNGLLALRLGVCQVCILYVLRQQTRVMYPESPLSSRPLSWNGTGV